MRLAIAALLMAATPAMACSEDILTIKEWSAAEKIESWSDHRFIEVAVDYVFNGPRPIRMIDGSFFFFDALGGIAGGLPLDRDQIIEPGKVMTESHIMSDSQSRLVDLPPSDITARPCVNGVVYDDGTVEEF